MRCRIPYFDLGAPFPDYLPYYLTPPLACNFINYYKWIEMSEQEAKDRSSGGH
jgi:hypothetical protein